MRRPARELPFPGPYILAVASVASEAYEVGAACEFVVELTLTLVEEVLLGDGFEGSYSGAFAHVVYTFKCVCLVALTVEETLGTHKIHIGKADKREVGRAE